MENQSLSTQEILKLRQQHLLPSATHSFKEPLHVTRASMQWVWDKNGKKYLDGFGAIVTISAGHNHPRINKKLKDWMDAEKPQHSTILYLTEPVVELAAKLVKISPDDLKKCFFTNSGSEANELAILLARQYTGRHEIIALKHGYHGGTSGTLSLVGQHTWKWGGPSLTGVVHAAQPNCYRCPWGGRPENCGLECADDVEDTIQTSTSGQIAGMFVEPIQGVGGFIVPPKDYFPRVQEILKKYGGLYISDEVQAGVGRTGKHWFGVLHNGIVPDMMTMAKGLGNGASIGGLITREEVSESMRGKIHFNTFAGNPWASIQALETLNILEEENVLDRATLLGDRIMEGLRGLQEKSTLIGDVRGRGLLIGVELVKNRKTKEYASAETLEVLDEARERGLLLGKGGLYGNVIRVTPPMCFSETDADDLVRILGESIEAVEARRRV